MGVHGSLVPGFMGAWVHRCTCSWVYGFMGSWCWALKALVGRLKSAPVQFLERPFVSFVLGFMGA